MLPKKQASGYQKRKKQKRIEEVTQSFKGGLDKFIIKEQQNINSVNENTSQSEELENNAKNKNETVNNVSPTKNNEDDHLVDEQPSNMINNFDPRNWDNLDIKSRDILVEKGPIRDLSLEKGPKDKLSRHFFFTTLHPFFTKWG